MLFNGPPQRDKAASVSQTDWPRTLVLQVRQETHFEKYLCKAEFSAGVTDILGWIILLGGCPVCSRIPGLEPLDARSTLPGQEETPLHYQVSAGGNMLPGGKPSV